MSKKINQIAEQLQIPGDGRDDQWLLSAISMKLSIILPLVTTADNKVLTTEDSIYTPEESEFTKTTFCDHGKMVTEFDHNYCPVPTPSQEIGVIHSHERFTPVSKCYHNYTTAVIAAMNIYNDYRVMVLENDDDDGWIYKPCRG